MTQPVQQQRFTEPHLHDTTSPDEIIQGELAALYHRSDALLRELTTVRRRMDELHAAIENKPITVDSLRRTIEARKAEAEA